MVLILAVASDALNTSKDLLHLYMRYLRGIYEKCRPSNTSSFKTRALFIAVAVMSFITPFYILWSYMHVAHYFYITGKIKLDI